jgi:DNA binding domain protein
MEHEIVNKETPEMKQLISGIREVSKRLREIAQTHRPLFGGEIYLTGREVCERLFVSPRTLQDYRDKGIIPYTQIAGKILYRLSDINQLLQENCVNRSLHHH